MFDPFKNEVIIQMNATELNMVRLCVIVTAIDNCNINPKLSLWFLFVPKYIVVLVLGVYCKTMY